MSLAASGVRLRIGPQGWLALLVSLGFTSTLLWQHPRPWGVLIAFAIMLALLYSIIRLPRLLRHCEVRWQVPGRIHANAETTLAVFFRTDAARPPLTLLVQDTPTSPPRYLTDLPGLSPTPLRVAWLHRFHERGPQALPGLHLHCEQPFGLVLATTPLAAEGTVLVLPALAGLRRDLQQYLQQWLDEDGHRGSGRGMDELSHLRAYRPGDPRRRVHWRASARAGVLLVAERVQPTTRRLAVAIDLGRMRPGRQLEAFVCAAATIIDSLCRLGWQTELHAPCWPGGRRGDRQRLLEDLALCQASAPSEAGFLPQDLPVLLLAAQPPQLPPEDAARVRWLGPESLPQLFRLPRELR